MALIVSTRGRSQSGGDRALVVLEQGMVTFAAIGPLLPATVLPIPNWAATLTGVRAETGLRSGILAIEKSRSADSRLWESPMDVRIQAVDASYSRFST